MTVYEYDAGGNVTTKTDALGALTTYTYDARGNQLTETDAARTQSRPRPTTRRTTCSPARDFEGNTSTTYTYDAHGRMLTTTDPDGRTTTNVYDAAGNLTADDRLRRAASPTTPTTAPATGSPSTDPARPTRPPTTYDAFGDALTSTTPARHVTTYTYDAVGRRSSETDAAGHTIHSSTTRRRLPTDDRQRGGVTTLTYDRLRQRPQDRPRPTRAARVTSFDYDVRGNLTSDDAARTARRKRRTYDAEGNVLTSDRADDGPTRRPSSTTRSAGAPRRPTPTRRRIAHSYDAVGRVLTTTDARGNVTTHAYAPNQETVTDALSARDRHHVRRLGAGPSPYRRARPRVYDHAYDGANLRETSGSRRHDGRRRRTTRAKPAHRRDRPGRHASHTSPTTATVGRSTRDRLRPAT